MRFLVDRCAGRRLTDWLGQQGHDAVYSPELGSDPGDLEPLAHAFQDCRILVTVDTDFGRLIFVEGTPHAGIIRLPDVPVARRIEIMSRILTRYADPLSAGAIVTVRGNKIRLSAVPEPPA